MTAPISIPTELVIAPSSPTSIGQGQGHGRWTLPSTKRALSDESVRRTIESCAAPQKRVRPSAYNDSESERHHQSRPTPPTFSTSKGDATMLGKAEDSAAIWKSKSARGSDTRPISTSLSRHPSEQAASTASATPQNERGTGNSGLQILGQVGITEYLQEDERPTFVIDTSDKSNVSLGGLHVLFANSALTGRPALLNHIRGKSDDPTLMLAIASFADFKSWALSNVGDTDTGGPLPFPFAGVVWKCSTIRKRLRVISGRVTSMTPPGQANDRRPNLKLYSGLGATSPGHSQDLLPSEAGDHLDAMLPERRESGGLGLMHDVSPSSMHEEDPMSVQSGSPLTNGDMGIGDLLAKQMSPRMIQQPFPDQSRADGSTVTTPNSPSGQGFFDWTRLPLSSSLPRHIQFARSVDWGATSLGPIDTWPPDLRGMCNLIMASPHPSAIYWGKEHVAIYNEAYIDIAGKKHPELMGMRYQDAWVEIWEAIEPIFSNSLSSAQTTMKDDDCLFLGRNGFLEETYFSWSIIPVIGDNGSVVGLYNPAFEKTRRKIAERRMLTLREVGDRTAAAREVSEFWSLILKGLEYNQYDAPLVLVYSLADDVSESDTASISSNGLAFSKHCLLEGALGVSAGHPAAPSRIDLTAGNEGFAAPFRKAMRSDKPIVLMEEDGTLDVSILEGVQWRGFRDPSRTIVIVSIRPTTGESTLGFLVMGTNPRRPYDEDYDLFVQLLGRQLATSVASVVLFEEEIKRREKAAKMAAQDRIELANQLAARTQEAVESENKFTRMAELAPVGMFIADSTGSLTYSNDKWFEISSCPRGEGLANTWMDHINPDDRPNAEKAWSTMMKHKVPISMELRFSNPRRDKNGNTRDTWVLASAYPEKGEDGQLKRIFGSVTDISTQKFAEDLQKRRMEEAMEMKRQQENFIDITSHEMRNPLSAILLCADEITMSLTQLRATNTLTQSQAIVLDSTVDAAQTITLCAQHQKRIVNDVLTLSKLDSAMLMVTPVDVQPVSVIQRALKMFEGELQTADIVLDLRVDESFHSLRVDWVRLDPSRLLQVLINLTTNAIKFTTAEATRTITVHLAASKDRRSGPGKRNIDYIPSRTTGVDITASSDWGAGEHVYLHFAVQDTGRGVTESEKKLLFQRFSQASPRTHVTYGGSGLGLFISRELVELQGGEIGVSSESGKGSTFAFYIQARRSSAPSGTSEDGGKHLAPGRNNSAKSMRISSLKLDVDTTPPTPPTSLLSESTSVSEGFKILIVEDNLVNQKVLARQLRQFGCEVTLANHGGEAIERLQESRFWKGRGADGLDINVILMDLEMPVMDGITCARKLRELQLAGDLVRHVPVIAVTANAREEQIKTSLEAGIDDVVSKPFRIPELLPKIRDLMVRFSMTADPR